MRKVPKVVTTTEAVKVDRSVYVSEVVSAPCQSPRINAEQAGPWWPTATLGPVD